MSPAVRYTIALVVGIVVAFGLTAVIESIGHAIYPSQRTVNWNDPTVLRDYVQRLPLGALLFVVAAWGIATFAGGFAAAKIARARAMLFAGIVGGVVLCATIANLVMIPHPAWMAVTGLAGIVVAAVAAGRLAAARGQGPDPLERGGPSSRAGERRRRHRDHLDGSVDRPGVDRKSEGPRRGVG